MRAGMNCKASCRQNFEISFIIERELFLCAANYMDFFYYKVIRMIIFFESENYVCFILLAQTMLFCFPLAGSETVQPNWLLANYTVGQAVYDIAFFPRNERDDDDDGARANRSRLIIN